MNKPIAVTGLAFLLVAVGLMCLLIALAARPMLGEAQGADMMVALFALIGLAAFVLAFGLFTLKPWAWPFGIAMVIASAVVGVLSILNRASLAGTVLVFAPALFLLAGLFLPDVRKAFGRDRSSAAKTATSSSNSKINQPNPESKTTPKEHKTGRRK
jgi:hypothetical protein